MRVPGIGLAVAAAALVPGWLAGQVRPAGPAGSGDAQRLPGEEAFEAGPPAQAPVREAFVYPAGSRRDPFQPLLPGDPGQPRFEELTLIGVVLSADPRRSVALVGVSVASPSAAAGGRQRTLRVRRDAVLGDMTVLRIEREHMVVEMTRFGTREQLELRLNRRRGGDGP